MRNANYDENMTLYSIRNTVTGGRNTVMLHGVAPALRSPYTIVEAAWTGGVPNPVALARFAR